MYSSKCIFFLFACLHAFASIHALDDQCELWNFIEDAPKIDSLNEVIMDIEDSIMAKELFDSLDPIKLKEPIKKTEESSFLGTNFQTEIRFENLSVVGVKTLKIKPIKIMSTESLQFGVSMNKFVLSTLIDVDVHQLTQTGCAHDEEEFLGLCYKKCSILTHGSHPLRTAPNTCSTNGCDADEEQQGLMCYKKCPEGYPNGVGPVCWSHCSETFGPEYKDIGLFCVKWWYPDWKWHPSVGRGVGRLVVAPWTSGFGCNGFGVSRDGGCATPYWRLCFTEMLEGGIIKKEKDCKPLYIETKVNIEIDLPKVDTEVKLLLAKCKTSATKCVETNPVASIIGNLISGVNLLKDIKRLDGFEIKSIDLNWKSVNAKIDVLFNGKQFAKELVDLIVNIITKTLHEDSILINPVRNFINKTAKNTLNDIFASTYANLMEGKCGKF